MRRVTVLVFHQPPRATDPPLTRLLREARERLIEHQAQLFAAAGADEWRVTAASDRRHVTFGEHLAGLVATETDGLIVLGSGAAPLLRAADAERLVDVARSEGLQAITNNRYSSDLCAVSDGAALRMLPPLVNDNALPRWLAERAGFTVRELPGRGRLAMDLDSPLDLALLSLASEAPTSLVDLARSHRLEVPRLAEIRAVADDPRAELLVFGRSGSRTLRWLERAVRCRVRFLVEERGLRGGSSLAPSSARPPRSVLGRLLETEGVASLGELIGELADGAILDTRVLLADRLGSDESGWPSAEDRFASDLARHEAIDDPWLRALCVAAGRSAAPIVLGAHSLVGPGIPYLFEPEAPSQSR